MLRSWALALARPRAASKANALMERLAAQGLSDFVNSVNWASDGLPAEMSLRMEPVTKNYGVFPAYSLKQRAVVGVGPA